jgi:hypothetical protein
MENIFLKSSTNVPCRGYKVRGKIIPQLKHSFSLTAP